MAPVAEEVKEKKGWERAEGLVVIVQRRKWGRTRRGLRQKGLNPMKKKGRLVRLWVEKEPLLDPS